MTDKPSSSGSQVDPLIPSKYPIVNEYLDQKLGDEARVQSFIDHLTGMIKIPTETFDDLKPVGQDDRWDVFFKLEEYLKKVYPLIFETLELTRVNVHGLVLTWKGTLDPKVAKPILLTAHQDVVPVPSESVSLWTHPPYSGFNDGEKLWGRGSTDDKGYMLNILESVTLLIEAGFKPARTVIIAFGFDEEISGHHGASKIAQYLQQIYGPDSIYFMMDEGTPVLKILGNPVALVGLTEKGYLDMSITVTAKGGHASNAPPHTSIGMLAEIVAAIENNPFAARLSPKNPIFKLIETLTSTTGLTIPHEKEISALLASINAGNEESEVVLGSLLAGQHAIVRSCLATSQAVDKISGGIKINALPEQATAYMNVRIAVESSVEEIKQHYIKIIKPIQEKYNLEFFPFTEGAEESVQMEKLILKLLGGYIDPAPVSPTDSEQYSVLSGTIRNSLRGLFNRDVVVAPGIMFANTDSRYYWSLTDSIYRFNPLTLDFKTNNIHTVDEFVLVKDIPVAVRFFADLILNSDGVVTN